MKTFLQNFLFLIGGKYSFFFNQEHRNMYKTQFTQYNDIYLLSFTFFFPAARASAGCASADRRSAPESPRAIYFFNDLMLFPPHYY